MLSLILKKDLRMESDIGLNVKITFPRKYFRHCQNLKVAGFNLNKMEEKEELRNEVYSLKRKIKQLKKEKLAMLIYIAISIIIMVYNYFM